MTKLSVSLFGQNRMWAVLKLVPDSMLKPFFYVTLFHLWFSNSKYALYN